MPFNLLQNQNDMYWAFSTKYNKKHLKKKCLFLPSRAQFSQKGVLPVVCHLCMVIRPRWKRLTLSFNQRHQTGFFFSVWGAVEMLMRNYKSLIFWKSDMRGSIHGDLSRNPAVLMSISDLWRGCLQPSYQRGWTKSADEYHIEWFLAQQ